MYEGRDMTELETLGKDHWSDDELQFFYFALQQVTPFLNEEGKSLQVESIEELKSRGGLS